MVACAGDSLAVATATERAIAAEAAITTRSRLGILVKIELMYTPWIVSYLTYGTQ